MMRNTEAITEDFETTNQFETRDRPARASAPNGSMPTTGNASHSGSSTVDGSTVDGSTVDGSTVDGSTVAELWPPAEADSFRARWRDIQLRFVDDPRIAAREADALVGDAVSALTSSLAARRDDLAGWRSTGSAESTEPTDTERLRVTVQRYRAFLDNLLDLDRTNSRQ